MAELPLSDEDMEKFPISEEDWLALFKLIEAQFTTGLHSVPAPVFFLHAGQPGSGKTQLNNLIRRQLADNLLECNADNLREFHPDAEEILRDWEADYPDLTWPAAKKWNDALIDTGLSRHYNLLIETTLKDAAQALATLARMKAAGYTTWLQVLAVPYRWSWLGIYARYEAIKMGTGVARIVKESDHDDRFKRLEENLRVVVASPDLDYFTIFRRQLKVEASASTALAPAAEGKEDVLDVFFAIVNHPMSEEEKEFFKEDCARVAQMMRNRGAWSASIEAFRRKPGGCWKTAETIQNNRSILVPFDALH